MSKIRWNLWFLVAVSTLFGFAVLSLVFGFMSDQFEFNGTVDANAIAVALVGVVSLIVGFVLGLTTGLGQKLTDSPAPPPAVTEETHLEVLKLTKGK